MPDTRISTQPSGAITGTGPDAAGAPVGTAGVPGAVRRSGVAMPELEPDRPAAGLGRASGRRRVGDMTSLVLGPLLRYVDATSATIWVETATAAEVTVAAGDRRATARTFARARPPLRAGRGRPGSRPARRTPYAVRRRRRAGLAVDRPGVRGVPAVGDRHARAGQAAADGVRLLPGQRRPRRGGQRRRSASTRCAPTRCYMAGLTESDSDDPDERVARPGALPRRPGVRRRDQRRRCGSSSSSAATREQAPWDELKDFEEYAHLYRLAWSRPGEPVAALDAAERDDLRRPRHPRRLEHQLDAGARRWRPPTGGTTGSSAGWRRTGSTSTSATSGPRSAPPTSCGSGSRRTTGPASSTSATQLDALADRADQQPGDLPVELLPRLRHPGPAGRRRLARGAGARARTRRSMLDDGELTWLDDQLQGDVDHLLIGTSLPFLLAPGLHHVESFSEAIAEGAWGTTGHAARRAGAPGAPTWSTGRRSSRASATWPRSCSRSPPGERGRAPRTITFLSGDVHHSYVAEAWPARRRRSRAGSCRRSARRSATRCRGACAAFTGAGGQARRRGVAGAAAVARGPGAAASRCDGRSPRGPGTTTTSRSSSCARRASGCGGTPARSSTAHRTGRC